MGEALQTAKAAGTKAWKLETKRLIGETLSNLKQLFRALEDGIMDTEK